jgi:hypothetical protein
MKTKPELAVTDDIFLAMMVNYSASCSCGNSFQSDGAPSHFFRRIVPFCTGSFLIVGMEEGEPYLGPLVSQI